MCASFPPTRLHLEPQNHFVPDLDRCGHHLHLALRDVVAEMVPINPHMPPMGWRPEKRAPELASQPPRTPPDPDMFSTSDPCRCRSIPTRRSNSPWCPCRRLSSVGSTSRPCKSRTACTSDASARPGPASGDCLPPVKSGLHLFPFHREEPVPALIPVAVPDIPGCVA